MKITVPEYFKEFKCIADKCEDTCCAGWGIVIDEETNEYYQNVKGTFGERLRSEIVNDGGENIFILKNNNCPFLDENKMCDIYKELGGESLCYTCKQYPRYTEEFGNVREIGISVSCPEAARIILRENKKSTFEVSVNEEEVTRYNDINARLYFELIQCRVVIYRILQNRDMDINIRCAIALLFVEKIQEKIDNSDIMEIKDVREEFIKKEYIHKIMNNIEKSKHKKYDRYLNMNKYINIFKELKHINPNDPLGLEDILRYFWQSDEDMELYFIKNKAFEENIKDELYKFENILVYFVFRYFMKAVFDYDALAKMKLAIVSYIVIRELALVRFIENGEFTNEDMVDIAHIYSKDVEHLEENIETLYELFESEESFKCNEIIKCLIN